MAFAFFEPGRTLYIETIGKQATEASLCAEFYSIYDAIQSGGTRMDSQQDLITTIDLPKFESTGKNQGYAFIEFKNEALLEKFMEIYAKKSKEDEGRFNILKLRWINMNQWLLYKHEYLSFPQNESFK
jgi:RNA recognition motif-containing protein